MNREIKFRACNKSEARMYSRVIVGNKIAILQYNHPDEGDDSVDFEPTYYTTDFTDGHIVIMQFTGIKDSNGIEIYEGDIVKDKFDQYIIEFGAGAFKMRKQGERKEHESKHRCYPVSTGVKVIGNIYENPELLNQPATS